MFWELFHTCKWLSVAKDLQCYLDIPNHQSERPPIDVAQTVAGTKNEKKMICKLVAQFNNYIHYVALYHVYKYNYIHNYTNYTCHKFSSLSLSSLKICYFPSSIHHHRLPWKKSAENRPLSLPKGNEALRCAGSTLGITILIDQALPEEHLGFFRWSRHFWGGRMPKQFFKDLWGLHAGQKKNERSTPFWFLLWLWWDHNCHNSFQNKHDVLTCRCAIIIQVVNFGWGVLAINPGTPAGNWQPKIHTSDRRSPFSWRKWRQEDIFFYIFLLACTSMIGLFCKSTREMLKMISIHGIKSYIFDELPKSPAQGIVGSPALLCHPPHHLCRLREWKANPGLMCSEYPWHHSIQLSITKEASTFALVRFVDMRILWENSKDIVGPHPQVQCCTDVSDAEIGW